jgi:hypothetical protein
MHSTRDPLLQRTRPILTMRAYNRQSIRTDYQTRRSDRLHRAHEIQTAAAPERLVEYTASRR